MWWSPPTSSQNAQNQRLMVVEGGAGWPRGGAGYKENIKIWEAERKRTATEYCKRLSRRKVSGVSHPEEGRGIRLDSNWRTCKGKTTIAKWKQRFNQIKTLEWALPPAPIPWGWGGWGGVSPGNCKTVLFQQRDPINKANKGNLC